MNLRDLVADVLDRARSKPPTPSGPSGGAASSGNPPPRGGAQADTRRLFAQLTPDQLAAIEKHGQAVHREGVKASPADAALVTPLHVLVTANVQLQELRQRCATAFDQVAARLEALEAAQLQYLGTWEDGKDYPANTLLTDRGCLWCSLRRTSQRPGSSPDWRLTAKSGGGKGSRS